MSQENSAKTNGKVNVLADAAEVAACLRAHSQFVMCAHEKPDGDVLGSGYALGLALKRLGKRVIYFLDDDVPKNLRFLPEWEITQRTFEGVSDDAIFIFFDMSDQSRAGKALQWVPRERIVNIDHHLGNTRFGRWNYVNEKEAATGSLVLGVIFSLGVEITSDIATCLLGTLISDTGCFQYSNASPHTLRLGAALIEAGADKNLITEQLYFTRTLAGQKVLGRALDAAVLTEDGVCFSVVTQAMLEEFGATHEDLEDVVGALRVVDRCEVAALFKESTDGGYRLSMRSRGRYNVMQIARTLGGGGHFRAAGATVPGPRDAAIESVLAAVRAEMAREEART